MILKPQDGKRRPKRLWGDLRNNLNFDLLHDLAGIALILADKPVPTNAAELISALSSQPDSKVPNKKPRKIERQIDKQVIKSGSQLTAVRGEVPVSTLPTSPTPVEIGIEHEEEQKVSISFVHASQLLVDTMQVAFILKV